MSNNKYCQRMKFSHLHQTIPSFLSQVTLEVTCIVLQLKTDSPKLTKKTLYTNTNKNIVVMLLIKLWHFPSLIGRHVKTKGALTPLHFIYQRTTVLLQSSLQQSFSLEWQWLKSPNHFIQPLFKNPRPNYKSSRFRDYSTCSEPEIPRLLFRKLSSLERFRDWADIFRDASLSHRPFYTPN